MRFVLANHGLHGAGGTETHLLTLGDQLVRLGHEVVVYAHELGPFSDHVRSRGIEVAADADALPAACDVVLAQDAIVAGDLSDRFPQAFMVFRVCSDIYDFELPPQLPGVVDLVVVLADRYARVARACSVEAPLLRLRLPVDLDRLVPIGPIRRRPRRAVVLGNYEDRLQAVREAWEPHGVEVGHVGGAHQRYDVAAALEGVDIVVAKSRAAVDAMACGRAVYVYDMFGGDGWVTPASYGSMEADNFAGQATDRVIGVAELEQDLADYDQRMGATNRDLALQHHSAREHAIEFLAAVDLRPRPDRPALPLEELSRLTALQWSWERAARESRRAQAELHRRLVVAEQAAADADARALTAERERAEEYEQSQAAIAALEAELAAIRVSRAWGMASRYWRLRRALLRTGT